MPEVGVLNLTIHDNSEEAGEGLGKLASALRRVQTALGSGMAGGLQELAGGVENLNKVASGNEKTVTSLGTLFNSLANFGKVKDLHIKDLAEPFTKLQEVIGKGFSLGQSGTQLNKMREALQEEWASADKVNEVSTVLHNIADGIKAIPSDTTEKANSLTEMGKALSEYARGCEDLKSAIGTGGTGGITSSISPITSEMMADRQATGRTGLLRPNLQFHAGGSDLYKVSETIKQLQPGYEKYMGTLEELKYKQLDVMSIMDKPLQYMRDIYKTPTHSMEEYKNATGAVLPKMQQMSSEEMVISTHARMATEAISNLLAQLNRVQSVRGFSNVVDALTGVSKVSQKVSDEYVASMEKVFAVQEQHKAPVETKLPNSFRAFDAQKNAYVEVEAEMEKLADGTLTLKNATQEATAPMREFIDLTQIPASGENGVFANAAEELRYLNGLLEQSVARTEEWSRTYDTIQKRIKYNGATEERTNALGQAERSFYAEYENVERINASISRLADYASKYASESGRVVQAAEAQARSMHEVADATNEAVRAAQAQVNSSAIQNIIETLNSPSNVKFADIVNNLNGIGRTPLSAEASMSAFLEEMNRGGAYADYIRELNPELAEASDRFTDAGAAAREYAQAAEEAKVVSLDLAHGFKGLGMAMKAMFPTLTGMLGRFKQLVKYRMLRSVIKHITSGFSEGVQNVYQYSKLIGSSFAPAMDEAATAIQQMKNSIGAAVAPAIQALIPYLQIAVNWFITLVNYVNQFFALLAGQKTWTRALPETANAFEKQQKAAKGAGRAMKDLLADWDELNIIQSQTNGGVGGGSAKQAEEYLNMFEEVTEFDNKIKDIVNFVKENFGEILATALAIKGALMAWRVSNVLEKDFPLLSKLASGLALGATIALSVGLTDITGKAFISSGNPGWFIADALAGAVGPYLAGKIAAKMAGAAFGKIASGFTLILEGAVNISNAVSAMEQQKEAESWMLGVLGSAQTGIGAALVAMGFKVGAAGAFVTGIATFGLTLAITAGLLIHAKKEAEYKQMALDAFASTGEGGIDPEEYLAALQTRLDEITKDKELIVNVGLSLGEHKENYNESLKTLQALNGIVSGGGALSKADAEKFRDAWKIVVDELGEIAEISYETLYAGLDQAIREGSEAIKKEAVELRTEALKSAAIMEGARGMLKKDMEFLEKEIIAGSTDPEVMRRYKQIYKELAKDTTVGLSDFREAMENGSNFDFGKENAIGAAVDFIHNMGTEKIQPALDQVQAAYDAEVKGINELQAELETYHNLGYIKDPQYEQLKSFYNEMLTFYADELERQKKEINDAVQVAMDKIAEQSIEGYLKLDQTDERALKKYVDEILTPIAKAIEEAGGQVPDKLKAFISGNGKAPEKADATALARDTSRYGIYSMFQEMAENGDIENPLQFALNYELDLKNGDASKIEEEAKKDITNTLIDVFGDINLVIEGLRNKFGWSIGDIIGYLDFSKLDTDDLKELEGILRDLKDDDIDELRNQLLLRPENANNMTWDDIQEDIGETEKYYDDLIKKIKEYNDLDVKPKDVSGSRWDPRNLPTRAAGMTVSDVGWSNNTTAYQAPEVVYTEPKDNGQESQNVAAGVQKGNADVVSELRSVVMQLTRLLNKEWSVNVTPSADWGLMNRRAGELHSKAFGEDTV